MDRVWASLNGGQLSFCISPISRKIGGAPVEMCRSLAPRYFINLNNGSVLAIIVLPVSIEMIFRGGEPPDILT